ncbi:hypothetical protein RCC89_17450 [Cytophagaceae bacterium ABcell3]|nr:hypothetical protein RCC89_17450 [Cytophagaceae bacterium ABcell3]
MDHNLKSRRALAYSGGGILAGLLLIGNTYFYLGNSELKEENQKHLYKVNSLSASNNRLENNLSNKVDEVEKLSAEKSKVESLLEKTTKSLKESQAKVAALTKENNALNFLKKEVADLKREKQGFLGQISDLHKRVMQLNASVSILNSENASLKEQIEELQSRNGTLEKKVALGAVIKTENIVGEGQRYTRGDKLVSVKRAKKAAQLAVSVDLAENLIADPGAKTVYMRVIDPRGKLIYNLENNSGSFVNMDVEKEMDYTGKQVIDYDNGKQSIDFFYAPKNNTLVKGEYKVEIYTDGYLSGVSSFSLK